MYNQENIGGLPDKPRIETLVQNNIPVLSFFTGAGFLDIGFLKAGFDIVWLNEHDPSIADGYEYGMSSFMEGGSTWRITNRTSIVDLDPKQIADEAFHGTPKPPIFGIIGGPPCPDFSNGGKKRGSEGDHGKLSQVYVDRIMALQPTFFLFENVPGLLNFKKNIAFFNKLQQQLSITYALSPVRLNALDFGVPQDRERVFLVGIDCNWLQRNTDKNSAWADWFPWPTPRYRDAKSRFDWPQPVPFGTTPEKPADIPDDLMVGPLICDLEEIAALPNGLDTFVPHSKKFRTIPEGDVSGMSFKRLHRWRYSPTVAYGNNEVHLHPTECRRLSVREAFRIQGVPDTYAFPQNMTLSAKFKAIANGVPVNLAVAVAESIKNFLAGTVGANV